jgi:hypothetical protein
MNNRCQTLHRNLHNMNAWMSIAIKPVTVSPECEGRTAEITSADTNNWWAATAVKRTRFIVQHKALNTQSCAQTCTCDRQLALCSSRVPTAELGLSVFFQTDLLQHRHASQMQHLSESGRIRPDWTRFCPDDGSLNTAQMSRQLVHSVCYRQDNRTNCLEEYRSHFIVNIDRC